MLNMYVLVGPISSGKSTWTRSKVVETGALVVNDDAIVTAIHGGEYTQYNYAYKKLYDFIGKQIIYFASDFQKDIIIDRTNLKKSSREKYIQLARENCFKPIAVVFPMIDPEVSAKRRFESDSRGHTFEKWLACAREHFNEYEPVDKKEFHNNIIYI